MTIYKINNNAFLPLDRVISLLTCVYLNLFQVRGPIHNKFSADTIFYFLDYLNEFVAARNMAFTYPKKSLWCRLYTDDSSYITEHRIHLQNLNWKWKTTTQILLLYKGFPIPVKPQILINNFVLTRHLKKILKKLCKREFSVLLAYKLRKSGSTPLEVLLAYTKIKLSLIQPLWIDLQWFCFLFWSRTWHKAPSTILTFSMLPLQSW